VEEAVRKGDVWSKAQADARLRRASDLLNRWTRTPDPTPVKVDMQILRIGDLAIVSMPGEPFAEIGAAIKKASPFAFTMFCGYSTGIGGGYMPVESEYEMGGYEIEMTPYGTTASAKLIKDTIALYQSVR
jgi:neutral ceramidase